MRRTRFPLIAISSAALLFACAASARTRPHYGDTVRAETHGNDAEVAARFVANPRSAAFKTDVAANGDVTVRAVDDSSVPRPYVDAIEFSTGRSSRDQLTDFTLDRADVVEVGSDQVRRAQQEHVRLEQSRPAETVYLVIQSNKPPLNDVRLRQAIAMSLDRTAIHNVIFQRQGDLAGSVLPNWLSGYAFLFATPRDVTQAKRIRDSLPNVPQLTIAYDANDPLERLIAERVALNARDAGINVQPVATGSAKTDLHLERVALTSAEPAQALNDVIVHFGGKPQPPASINALYQQERAFLESYVAIPLVHLPRMMAVKDWVRNWSMSPIGRPDYENLWIDRRTEAKP